MSECKVCKEQFHYCSSCSLDPEHPRTYGYCSWNCMMEDKDATIARLTRELEEATRWISDLQSGMYINCVYCGHRYGPKDKVPCTMADALKQHIEQCPKHPMSKLKAENAELKADNLRLKEKVCKL